MRCLIGLNCGYGAILIFTFIRRAHTLALITSQAHSGVKVPRDIKRLFLLCPQLSLDHFIVIPLFNTLKTELLLKYL
jgi:hypothetical protein